jgi:glycosyltransferase involved in cell wall biosynthesis
LEARALPLWVFDETFYFEGKNVTYFDLCSKTPLLFFNHYFYGLPERLNWPKEVKPIYMMPNIEMYDVYGAHYTRADVIFCKTLECTMRLKKWFEQEGNPLNTTIVYTRHTSPDPTVLTRYFFKAKTKSTIQTNRSFQDDQLTFVHTAGKSPFKGTHQILDCWLQRPDFKMPLDIYIRKDRYEEKFQPIEKQFLHDSRINFHVETLNASLFGEILLNASVLLCPSHFEGYGHYINQARASGALVVTTNAPPMNELIKKESGVLVFAARTYDKNQFLGGDSYATNGLQDVSGLATVFTAKEVCKAIDFIQKQLNQKQRQTMAQNSKEQYLKDLKYFRIQMAYIKQLARTVPKKKLPPIRRI